MGPKRLSRVAIDIRVDRAATTIRGEGADTESQSALDYARKDHYRAVAGRMAGGDARLLFLWRCDSVKENKLRRKLQAGEQTVCTRVFHPTPAVVEILGQTGLYDYVEFVAEYGSFHLHDLDNLCRAAELYGMGAMIKIDQSHQAFLAQRGIGAGFDGVLFTDCRSAEDVRTCVRLARPDTPTDRGLYGAAVRRNVGGVSGGADDYVQAIRDIVVCVMVEKKGAVDELEQVLSVPGLDMVQWGGTDFSMSIGRIGQRDHPDVLAAKRKVFADAIAKGVPPRAEIASVDEAQEYLDMGVRHFSVGADVRYLYFGWQSDGERLRAVLDG